MRGGVKTGTMILNKKKEFSQQLQGYRNRKIIVRTFILPKRKLPTRSRAKDGFQLDFKISCPCYFLVGFFHWAESYLRCTNDVCVYSNSV